MTHDMKHGKPTPVIVSFAIPIVLGNLFQQLYNTVDSVIIGRFQGELSLAAIGVSNPIMSVAIFLLFGICVGISVLLAQLYGAEEYEKFQQQISTALILGAGFTILLSFLFFFASKKILLQTKTPPEIIPQATAYLKIISVGLIFTFLYNFYSSVLRATGDSKTPFLFLLISSVANVFLDLLFIVVFKMGVAGAAIATVVAQALSSALCIAYVNRNHSLLALNRKKLVFRPSLVKNTLSYSWITAMQQTFLYLGRLLVQSVINGFGASSIAAFNSAVRIEALAYAPMDGLSSSASTFFAQNMGAKQPERIEKGFQKCLVIAVLYSILIGVTLYFIPEKIMGIFVKEAETNVISIGALYLQKMSFFYVIGGCMYILQGFFRGIKKLTLSFFATFTQIIIRIVLAHLLAPTFGIVGVCYATVIGWIWMFSFEGILSLIYFHKEKRNPKKINTND